MLKTSDISSLSVIMSIKNAILFAKKQNCSVPLEFAGISFSVNPESDLFEKVVFWETEYEKSKK
jgi:hypothetical protein